jgi:hypothetical protein
MQPKDRRIFVDSDGKEEADEDEIFFVTGHSREPFKRRPPSRMGAECEAKQGKQLE